MGYDAYVKCNCFQEGKYKTPPPHKEHIATDEEGIYLDLKYQTHRKELDEFHQWIKSNPCGHPWFQYYAERLSNSSGMAAFRTIIEELGKDKYPLLNKHLPTANGGGVPKEDMPAFIEEVNRIRQDQTMETILTLWNVTHDRPLHRTNIKYRWTFAFFSYNYRYRISANGFQYLMTDGGNDGDPLFTSHRFTQEKLDSDKYLFKDVQHCAKTVTTMALADEVKTTFQPVEFEVRQESVAVSSQYSYIIEPLVRLCKAAQETGNPIVWC